MKRRFANMAWTTKAALAALVLGFGALQFGNPQNGELVRMDIQELALKVQNADDHVSVHELADWIIASRADYRLIDVRSGNEFRDYHIPSAENIEVGSLVGADLPRNEKIIVYSEGGIHAAQAWMLLSAMGYKNSYMLSGGLEEWRTSILFPHLPETANPSQQDSLAKIESVSAYFGGTIQSGERQAAAPEISMPVLKSPTATSATPKTPTAKKKKEGC